MATLLGRVGVFVTERAGSAGPKAEPLAKVVALRRCGTAGDGSTWTEMATLLGRVVVAVTRPCAAGVKRAVSVGEPIADAPLGRAARARSPLARCARGGTKAPLPARPTLFVIASPRALPPAALHLRHSGPRYRGCTRIAPWSDGTVALVLEPLDLCARIAALIPPPRFHMIRPRSASSVSCYHGVLSSHAKLRPEVVPKAEETGPKQLALFEHDRTVLPPEPRKRPWAWLLRHVFQVDVVTCLRSRFEVPKRRLSARTS